MQEPEFQSAIQMAMASAVEEVLETMCFTGVLGSEEASPAESDGDDEAITAALSFHGQPSGDFRVSVPRSMARGMSGCFLGEEEEAVSDAQTEQVVCELANMICGSVLSRIGGGQLYDLTHPELTGSESQPATTVSRRFDLGDGMLTASMQLAA